MITSVLRKIYDFGTLTEERRDFYQKIIRDAEWDAIQSYVPHGASFLDVGCGAGYNLVLAKAKSCVVTGVDPTPYKHGVGRVEVSASNPLRIIEASAEKLPFPDNAFHVVFSSHVLEHIRNKELAFNELERVMERDGVMILGMPTATMAWINLVSQLLFNTHKRFFHIFGAWIKGKVNSRYMPIHLLIPRSHSFKEGTVFQDIKTYKIEKWKREISEYFEISKIVMPALYPYPDFVQLFKLRKSRKFSSSVFFVCRKKGDQ